MPSSDDQVPKRSKRFSKLHKYKAIDPHLCELIADSQLYFSGRTLLNDPNEAVLRFTMQQELVDEGFGDNEIVNLGQPLYSSIGNFYFFCMSLDPADILLWGYYGDNHRGVCLEFDFGMAIQQWLGKPEKPWKIETDHGTPFIREVHYTSEFDEFMLAPDGSPNLSSDEWDEFGFRKLDCWQAEKEVRMRLGKNQTQVDEIVLDGIKWRIERESLKAIRFGLKTDGRKKQKIYDLVRSRGHSCEFLEGHDIAKSGNRYAVLFRPYAGG